MSAPLCVEDSGLTLHAATTAPRRARAGLEALCRYILRPAIPLGRVRWLEDDRGELSLSRPWAPG